MSERPPFEEPSLFWQGLAREHAAELERYGLPQIKRRQALRYFTWRWRCAALRESHQLRFLFTHSSPATFFRCLFSSASLSGSGWDGVSWPRRERWLYVYAVRLLWEYALKSDELGVLKLPEPELGNPLPVYWKGRLISQDLANSALEASLIARSRYGTSPRSIVEVGAGYGRTAYALLSVFPDATYTVVDIEPALTISRWYLTSLLPAKRLQFMRPSDTGRLGDASIDLVVSVSSLHEMRFDQVEAYLRLFDRIAAGGAVYLKQWERWTNPADGVTLAFDEYPIPSGWRTLVAEPAPVQTNFRQAVWRVRPT